MMTTDRGSHGGEISSSLYHAAELINLGEWLSARTRFPFDRPSKSI